MGIVYLLVASFATMIGAISGFGGGVIIKPVLDALGDYNAFVIGVLSSFTVLCMAVVSTIKSIRKGFVFEKKIVYATIGAVIGGIAGKELFDILYDSMDSNTVTIVQASMLCVLLIVVLFKNKLRRYDIETPWIIILAGISLGSISSFLGIGGGPFNIVVLSMLFNLDIKQAATVSIFIILFSQGSNLTSIMLTTGFQGYDFSMLYYMVPAGIVGGFVGAEIGGTLSKQLIEKFYFVIIIVLLLLNTSNIIKAVV